MHSGSIEYDGYVNESKHVCVMEELVSVVRIYGDSNLLTAVFRAINALFDSSVVGKCAAFVLPVVFSSEGKQN